MKENRLYFLDAVRAFAILMMLQGHFIDGLLHTSYKSSEYVAFTIWNGFRGNTAPLFFTITGLVILYLLKKAESKGNENLRIKKGFKRGASLLLIGYSLRIPIFSWLAGHIDSYFLVIDVLQIIGISVILLNGCYALLKNQTKLLASLLTGIGVLVFASEPVYRTLTLPQVPDILVNYITKENGSVFTLLPWFGFVAFGAVLGIIFQKFQYKPQFKTIAISSFIFGGLFLNSLSSEAFYLIYKVTHIELFYNVANYNYLFIRLGNVLLVFGVFYALESYLKHPLILKLGNNTLSIYVVHFIILYGSYTGFGLYRYAHNSLEPWSAVLGALAFMSVVCLVVIYEDKIKAFLNINIRKAWSFIKLKSMHRPRLHRS
ncbi:heparan-alpha-glucosaminide N-acetyltransferase domain-containing protein [Formosa sp. 4Alg 33]|uniref:heparan-alpha-glucosaminide N-acetyltransferase domain-containing protein n=1 Tax=Formosa sp. 4Alg 33 TaxID=3382189 RepID=UPI003D9C4DDE